jgi:hypothetical protein
LGGHAARVLTDKRLAEAKHCFETSIKIQFDGFDSEFDDDFEVPLNGADDLPDCGLEAGYLKLNK